MELEDYEEPFVGNCRQPVLAFTGRFRADAGVPNNTALIFSELMDAKSLFLTANADTVYFFVNLDATKGPIVVETPPLALGVVDDMWFHWITDFGLPGADRGEGGKYLLKHIRAVCRVSSQIGSIWNRVWSAYRRSWRWCRGLLT